MQRLEVRPGRDLSQLSTMNADLHATSKSSRPPQTSTPDYEGIEISLLLNVIQVADLRGNALDHADTGDPSSAAADIRLYRQTLQDVLRSQSRHSSLHEGLPIAKTLPPDMNLRHLPLPTIENVMVCLKMVRGIRRIA